MYNQIRAEFYKLFHTKALYLTFALILAVFGIFSIGGQQQFVVSSSSVDETWKIGETVGFLARAYSDQVHPMSLRNGAWFYCRHSEVAETLPCHGVRIKMADLEQVVFETIRAQMCPALGIDSNKDKLDLQTVQQAEHEEKLRSIQDSKRYLYEQYALGEIDLETYRTRKAVYDTELVQAKNVHAVITAQTKQIKSDYEIKLKQQEIVQKVGNANMLTKALIDRLINKVYVFPGDRIEIEYATQDFLETKESEKEV